jgi:hypothetical protein
VESTYTRGLSPLLTISYSTWTPLIPLIRTSLPTSRLKASTKGMNSYRTNCCVSGHIRVSQSLSMYRPRCSATVVLWSSGSLANNVMSTTPPPTKAPRVVCVEKGALCAPLGFKKSPATKCFNWATFGKASFPQANARWSWAMVCWTWSTLAASPWPSGTDTNNSLVSVHMEK